MLLTNAPSASAPTVAIAAFLGELDAGCARWFARQLRNVLEQSQSLVVDVKGVTFVDSSILAELVALHRLCGNRAGQLVLAHPSATLNRILEVTGLSRVLVVQRDLEDALASIVRSGTPRSGAPIVSRVTFVCPQTI